MATFCQATVENHCCWIPGAGVCPHFNPTLTGGFCTLMAELGDWALVHDDPRYAPQRAAFEAWPSVLCGDFPAPGTRCGTCGVVGDG